MKNNILSGLFLIILLINSSTAFDYLEINEKYGKSTEKNYESMIYQIAPDSDLLEVSCFFWEDYISMTATTDNSSFENTAALLYASLRAYIYLYNDLGYPNKAEISIKKPSGLIGSPIASAIVYSKWVDEYNKDLKTDMIKAQSNISRKFADTITGY